MWVHVHVCSICQFELLVQIPQKISQRKARTRDKQTFIVIFFFFSLQNILSMLEDHDSDASSSSSDSESTFDIEDEGKEDEYDKLDNKELQEALR